MKLNEISSNVRYKERCEKPETASDEEDTYRVETQ